MDSFDIPESSSDYYADLGLPQEASFRDVKLAFIKLAKKCHPDKKAPGTTIDAKDFRKVREAYECLIDKEKRAKYDATYFNLRDQWTRYQEKKEARRQDEERKRAEEEKLAARERAERERKAEEARKMAEDIRAANERAEHRRRMQERARQAEERSREAARKAREQQEQAAKERIRQYKERKAERKSEEAARKLRMEQEQAARERLKLLVIEEHQDVVRRNWAKMREAAEHGESKTAQYVRSTRTASSAKPAQFAPSGGSKCNHPRFGWPRKNGKAICASCKNYCAKWSFRCPECNVPACAGCKYKYCVY